MITKLKSREMLDLLIMEAPPLVASLMTAEFFFKFGSFLLEALAFVALWFLLRVPHTWLVRLLSKQFRAMPAPKTPTRS